MLEIRNVVKTFGKNVTAVDDVSLVLKAGGVGLTGHSAGKTTLMQMIAP